MTLCERVESKVLLNVETDPPSPEELAHAIDCESCRELWVSAQLLEESPRFDDLQLQAVPATLQRRAVALGEPRARGTGRGRRSTGFHWAVGLATAAGLASLAVGLGLLRVDRRSIEPDSGATALRGAEIAAPMLVSPRGDVASNTQLAFTWRYDGESAGTVSFHLVVVDLDTGSTVLEATTERPTYSPTSVERTRLRAGSTYHWIVEPRMDGVALSPSAPTSFRLSP